MIIVLDESIAATLETQSSEGQQSENALNICLQQAAQGHHIVVADRHVFERILHSDAALTKRARAVLSKLADRMTQSKALVAAASVLVRLVAGTNSEPTRHEVASGREEIVITTGAVNACSELLGLPGLLVENAFDGRLYLKLATTLIQGGITQDCLAFRGITLRADIKPGGGHTLGELVALENLRRNQLGLVIADSDIDYPGGSLGETAKAVQSVSRQPDFSCLITFVPLPVRAIENLIPLATLVRSCGALDKSLGAAAMRTTTSIGTAKCWTHHNIKDGRRCFELVGESNLARYWTRELGATPCRSDDACESKKKCNRYILDPTSDKVVRYVSETSDSLDFSGQHSAEVRDAWNLIAHIIASWFCGHEAILVL